jgi:hypothetical protein
VTANFTLRLHFPHSNVRTSKPGSVGSIQESLIGLPHLVHGKTPISATLSNGSVGVARMMLPCAGREHAALSVTGRSHEQDGDVNHSYMSGTMHTGQYCSRFQKSSLRQGVVILCHRDAVGVSARLDHHLPFDWALRTALLTSCVASLLIPVESPHCPLLTRQHAATPLGCTRVIDSQNFSALETPAPSVQGFFESALKKRPQHGGAEAVGICRARQAGLGTRTQRKITSTCGLLMMICIDHLCRPTALRSVACNQNLRK